MDRDSCGPALAFCAEVDGVATGEMTGIVDLPGVLSGWRQIFLYDYATAVPVFRFDEIHAQVPLRRPNGEWWISIVCCGPGAHLPERAA